MATGFTNPVNANDPGTVFIFDTGLWSASPAGAIGTILTSNGPGILPSYKAPSTTLVSYTNVSTSPYVVLSTDQYLSVDTSALAITIQLPNSPTQYRTFTIKDRTGAAFTRNITVTTVGGVVLIDGSASFIMNINYESIALIFNGTSYEIN